KLMKGIETPITKRVHYDLSFFNNKNVNILIYPVKVESQFLLFIANVMSDWILFEIYVSFHMFYNRYIYEKHYLMDKYFVYDSYYIFKCLGLKLLILFLNNISPLQMDDNIREPSANSSKCQTILFAIPSYLYSALHLSLMSDVAHIHGPIENWFGFVKWYFNFGIFIFN
ncbi:hypothetical protein ACJX0J_016865, partial [Zea mays]